MFSVPLFFKQRNEVFLLKHLLGMIWKYMEKNWIKCRAGARPKHCLSDSWASPFVPRENQSSADQSTAYCGPLGQPETCQCSHEEISKCNSKRLYTDQFTPITMVSSWFFFYIHLLEMRLHIAQAREKAIYIMCLLQWCNEPQSTCGAWSPNCIT